MFSDFMIWVYSRFYRFRLGEYASRLLKTSKNRSLKIDII